MKKTPGRPFLLVALTLFFAATSTACQSVPKESNPDLRSLQGYWEGTGPGGPCSVTISDNGLYFHARDDFWWETTFTLLTDTEPKQLHATINKNSSPDHVHVGTMVVTIFKVEGEKLHLGVVEDFEEPPTEAIVGDWEKVLDLYELERAQPPAR